jgi:hypothetical protein
MSEESTVRVLIADDHPLMVGGLRQAVLAAAAMKSWSRTIPTAWSRR